MNKDLFPTPKDAEIARLRYIIQRFREYDARRTEDYKRVYKELEWYKEELNQIVGDDKKAAKIKGQRETIARLETQIAMNKMKDFTPSEIDKYKLLKENTALKMQLERKNNECDTLKREISKLVTQLNQK